VQSATSRVKTGVQGLDDVLSGGLPRTHLYLLEGDPGTGKTTLALQFLLEGVKAGEKALYVTLSESKRELEGVAESHGWSLAGVPIFELVPVEEELSPEAQYTVFHPSDVELTDTTTAVLKQVEEIQPSRIVFDSLSELRMLARDPLRYRRQILGLKHYFADRECTVLLLDDRTAEGSDLQLQSIAHGVIMLQSLEREFGVKRRRLEVRKMRGSRYREGYHDFAIETGGVVVFPRLVAAEHKASFTQQPVPSGLQSLDKLLGGGIDTGTSTLLMGPAGCGKSTIAVRYVTTAAERGDHSVIFAFDETVPILLSRAKGLGMSLEPHLASGTVGLQQVDPTELSPGEFVSRVRRCVSQGAKLVVIDSLNGFLNAMPGENFLALQLHELLAYLNQQGVATILTLAQHGFFGSMQSVVDVSYLADCVLLLRYYEAAGEVRKAISVLKKRTGQHEQTIRELIFADHEIRVGPPLSDFEGVLTGVPKFRGNAGEGRTSGDDSRRN
jgi:circadian clock protein KaiC